MPKPGQWADSEALTFAQYAREWLAHMRGRIRPTTHRGYAGLLELYALPAIGEVPLAQLRPMQLQRLYGDLLGRGSLRAPRGLSAGTVLNLHRVMVQALGCAKRWGLITDSPAASADPPRPRRPEPAVVDPPLVHQILEAARGTPLELPAAIAIATGMRRGE